MANHKDLNTKDLERLQKEVKELKAELKFVEDQGKKKTESLSQMEQQIKSTEILMRESVDSIEKQNLSQEILSLISQKDQMDKALVQLRQQYRQEALKLKAKTQVLKEGYTQYTSGSVGYQKNIEGQYIKDSKGKLIQDKELSQATMLGERTFKEWSKKSTPKAFVQKAYQTSPDKFEALVGSLYSTTQYGEGGEKSPGNTYNRSGKYWDQVRDLLDSRYKQALTTQNNIVEKGENFELSEVSESIERLTSIRDKAKKTPGYSQLELDKMAIQIGELEDSKSGSGYKINGLYASEWAKLERVHRAQGDVEGAEKIIQRLSDILDAVPDTEERQGAIRTLSNLTYRDLNAEGVSIHSNFVDRFERFSNQLEQWSGHENLGGDEEYETVSEGYRKGVGVDQKLKTLRGSSRDALIGLQSGGEIETFLTFAKGFVEELSDLYATDSNQGALDSEGKTVYKDITAQLDDIYKEFSSTANILLQTDGKGVNQSQKRLQSILSAVNGDEIDNFNKTAHLLARLKEGKRVYEEGLSSQLGEVNSSLPEGNQINLDKYLQMATEISPSRGRQLSQYQASDMFGEFLEKSQDKTTKELLHEFANTLNNPKYKSDEGTTRLQNTLRGYIDTYGGIPDEVVQIFEEQTKSVQGQDSKKMRYIRDTEVFDKVSQGFPIKTKYDPLEQLAEIENEKGAQEEESIVLLTRIADEIKDLQTEIKKYNVTQDLFKDIRRPMGVKVGSEGEEYTPHSISSEEAETLDSLKERLSYLREVGLLLYKQEQLDKIKGQLRNPTEEEEGFIQNPDLQWKFADLGKLIAQLMDKSFELGVPFKELSTKTEDMGLSTILSSYRQVDKSLRETAEELGVGGFYKSHKKALRLESELPQLSEGRERFDKEVALNNQQAQAVLEQLLNQAKNTVPPASKVSIRPTIHPMSDEEIAALEFPGYGSGEKYLEGYEEVLKESSQEQEQVANIENTSAKIEKKTKAVKKMKQALEEATKAQEKETKAEQAKVPVLVEEAKLFKKDATEIENLAQEIEVLTTAQDKHTSSLAMANGAQQDWTRITTKVKPLSGFKSATAGGYEPIFETLKELNEVHKGSVIPKLSEEDLAKRFNYNTYEDFAKERDDVKYTERGTFVHSIVEALNAAGIGVDKVEAARLGEGFGVDSIRTLVGGSKEALSIFNKSLIDFTRNMQFLGFNDEEIAKRLTQGAHMGASTQELYQRKYAGRDVDTLSEVTIGRSIEEGKAEKGTMDVLSFTNQGKELTIGDFKTSKSGKLDASYFAQVINYKDMVEQLQEDFDRDTKSGQLNADQWLSQYNKTMKTGGFEELSKEAFDKLLEVQEIYTEFFISMENGVATYAKLDLNRFQREMPDLYNKFQSGDATGFTQEERERVMALAPVSTSKQKGQTVQPSQYYTTLMGSQQAFTQQEENEGLSAYLTLLKQRYELEFKIYKLKEEQQSSANKGDIVGAQALADQLSALDSYRIEVQSQMTDIENQFGGFSDKSKARISKATTLQDLGQQKNTAEYNAIASINAQKKVESEYQSLLNKKLTLLRQIEEAQKKTSLSYDRREKESLQAVVSIAKEQLSIKEKQIAQLNVEKTARASVIGEMNANYEIQKRTLEAQTAAKNKGATNIWQMMQNDIKRATMRIFDMGVAYKALNQIPQQLRKIVELTKQLDASMTNLRIVTNGSAESATALLSTYQRLGSELGVTTQEVSTSAVEWLRQGYNTAEVGKLIESSMKLSKLGMIDASEATQYMTSALKGFKLEVEDAITVVDKLTTIDLEAAVSAGGLAQALSKTATSAQLAGLSMDQTLGVVATIGEVTQKSMDSVGDSVKTLLSRLGNVKAGVFDDMLLSDDADATDNINDIEKVLGKLGLSIRNSNLEMKDAGTILDDLSKKWQTLDTVSKNAVATAFAGVRQRENFLVLMENYDRSKELAEESMNSSGTADRKYGAYLDSLEASVNGLTNAWEEFTLKLQASPFLKTMTDALALFIKHFDRFLTLAASIGGLKLWQNFDKIKGMFGGSFGGAKDKALGGSLFWDPNKSKTVKDLGDTAKDTTAPITEAIRQASDKEETILSRVAVATEKLVTMNQTPLRGSNAKGVVYRQFGDKFGGGKEGFAYATKGMKDPKAPATDMSHIAKLAKENPELIQVETSEGVFEQFDPQVHTELNLKLQTLIETLQANTTSTDKATLVEEDTNAEQELTQAVRDNKVAVVDNSKQLANATNQEQMSGATQGSFMSKWGQGIKSRLSNPGALLSMGAMSGITAGMTQSETTRTLDSGATVSVESGLQDKLVKGIATGGMTALGTAVAGPIGGMIGSMLGTYVGDGINKLLNQAELDRKERVQEAAEQLEALNNIHSSLENYNSLLSNENWDSDDWASAKTVVDDLHSTLTGDWDVYQNFIAAAQNLSKDLGTTVEDWYDIYDLLMNGTQEQKESLYNTAMEEILKSEREATLASQEEIYYSAQEAMKDGISYWQMGFDSTEVEKALNSSEYTQAQFGAMDALDMGLNAMSVGGVLNLASITAGGLSGAYEHINFTIEGATLEETIANANSLLQDLYEQNTDGFLNDAIDEIEDYVAQLKTAQGEITSAQQAIVKLEAQIGYLNSAVGEMTQEALADLSYEGVINAVAKSMEEAGYIVRNEAGYITDMARQEIEALIKSDSTMSALVRGATQDLDDILENAENFSKIVGDKYTWQELKNILDTQGVEGLEEIAEELDTTAQALANLTYAANPETIYDLAHALNMTTEQLIAMQEVLGDVTWADATLSASDVREKFDDYYSIYEDLASGAALTQDNLEMLISKYPELIKYMGDAAELESHLASKLFGEDTSYSFLYENALFEAMKSSSTLFKEFKENNEDLIDSLGEDLKQAFEEATTFDQIWQTLMLSDEMIGENSEYTEALKEALIESFADSTYEIDKSRIESVMEYQQHMLDEQVDNLTEQKEALTAINEQREKELSLIKAQQALENAQDEKVRVYREGIGWTYETNQQAVNDARSTLEDLELQKEQENLELEIERLNLAKEILEDIVSTEEIEGLKNIYENWASEIEGYTEGQVSILTAIAEAYDTIATTDYADKIASSLGSEEEREAYYLDLATQQYSTVAEAYKALSTTTAAKGSDEYNALVQDYQNAQSTLNTYLSNTSLSHDQFGTHMTTSTEEGGGGLSESEYDSSRLTDSSNYTDSNALVFEDVYGIGSNSNESRKIELTTGSQVPESILQEEFPAATNQYRSISSDGRTIGSWSGSGTNIALGDIPDGALVGNNEGNKNYYLYKKNGNYYYIATYKEGSSTANTRGQGRWATGTESLPEQYGSDMNLINELGTEAIVTPSGTLTALPSKTGIVPADITRNLWELGEIAPTLIAGISGLNNIPELSNLNGGSVHNDGTFIDNLSMQVYPTKDYDMDKFITEVKQKARISKHTR